MKKTRLSARMAYEFELIGLVSPAKEYKLAWYLNQLDQFHLTKSEDIVLEFSDRNVRVSVLQDETEFKKVHLLKNRLVSVNDSVKGYLLPELQRFDYLLKISDQIEENWSNNLLLSLKNLPIIDYAINIEVGKLKMKDNLVF